MIKETLRSDSGNVFTSPETTSVTTKRNYAPSVSFDFDNANLRGIEQSYSQGLPTLGKIFIVAKQAMEAARRVAVSTFAGPIDCAKSRNPRISQGGIFIEVLSYEQSTN